MTKFVTTLNQIRKHSPCKSGWTKLLASLNKTCADDDPVTLEYVLQSNGPDDAVWCLRTTSDAERDIRLFAVWCARQVEHLSSDPRVKACNDTIERFANGTATLEELQDADAAAYAAYTAAYAAAAYAARDAAAAAYAAADAAYAAAAAAAYAAADAAYAAADAAYDAAYAAYAAAAYADAYADADAAYAAAYAAAAAAVRRAQSEMFVKMCKGNAPWQTKTVVEKYCVNCKHSSLDIRRPPYEYLCQNPNNAKDLVTGRPHTLSCESERSIHGECGISAKLFEEK